MAGPAPGGGWPRSRRGARPFDVHHSHDQLLIAALVMELVAISAVNETASSDRANLLNGLYGVPVTIAGIGLLAGGIGLLRTPRSARIGPAWLRVLPVMMGAYVFIPLTPATMGPTD